MFAPSRHPGPTAPLGQCLRGAGLESKCTPFMVPMMGSVPSYALHGQVAVVTGGSRGLGKGIALELAAAGCIVYITGRSTSFRQTEVLLSGSVDETAAQATRRGGAGSHNSTKPMAPKTHREQAKQLVKILEETHGRVDLLVNNAFFMPKPDALFFATPVWKQPCRLFDEQFCIGARNHVVLTLSCRHLLSRARGTVISVSSAGSQGNTDVFPVSYHANKACYDRMMLALSTKFPDVPMLTLWPGSVATERMVVGKRRFQGWLQDAETPSFTGRAVLLLSKLSFEAKLRLSGRTVTSAEVLYMAGGYDVDGYRHDLPRETMFATAQSFLQAPAKTRVTV
ncbi:unnamed protein product [Durusdinium trenchii]|uniref:Dehydrogenase/reductase SDR family member 1 n=1 Tax=Durusdinium trenchii TaxID=1381693 RepID=A0ABP0HJ77_9DINO